MKKIFFLLLFMTTISNGQSLNDLFRFRSLGLNQIEEKLILEDWKFISSKKEKEKELPDIGSSSFLDVYNASISDTYESRTYEYVGYAGDITTIEITEYADNKQNKIEITSENSLVYKNILNDLLASNFSLSNESCPYESYYLGDYNIGEKIIVESNGKVYKSGKSKVHVLINRYAVVESKSSYDNTFTYDQNK